MLTLLSEVLTSGMAKLPAGAISDIRGAIRKFTGMAINGNKRENTMAVSRKNLLKTKSFSFLSSSQ
jgi:hypothetical protein